MNPSRDRATLLSVNEIENIKVCQAVINRMADNSARIKNWFFVLSAAFVALLGSGTLSHSLRGFLGYTVIALVMWYTDARYLQLEQLFRGVNNRIVNGCQPNLDSWMLCTHKGDAESIWRLMLRNFSTVVYPVAIFGLLVLSTCA